MTKPTDPAILALDDTTDAILTAIQDRVAALPILKRFKDVIIGPETNDHLTYTAARGAANWFHPGRPPHTVLATPHPRHLKLRSRRSSTFFVSTGELIQHAPMMAWLYFPEKVAILIAHWPDPDKSHADDIMLEPPIELANPAAFDTILQLTTDRLLYLHYTDKTP